jgi:lipopolysaccharide biosynthesis glycosyltransferase
MKKIYIVLSLFSIIAGVFYFLLPKTVHLVYMVDRKYMPYAMVSIQSAIMNKKKSTHYHIHILAEDFNSEDKNKLQQMATSGIRISIYQTENKDFDYRHLGRFSGFKISLQKIFIADYLKEQNKVIYLDADTLVQNDLSSLYATDISHVYVAAVKDGLMYQHPEHITELQLQNPQFYFNSGVMLLNLKKIREDKKINSALIYFNTHYEIFGDQDILNVVFSGKTEEISYLYNVNSVFFEEKSSDFLSDFWKEKVPSLPENVYNQAFVLHFAGHKPWTNWFTEQQLKSLWWGYAAVVQKQYDITF